MRSPVDRENHLSVYLAEMDVVFAQMHTRMQIISAYMGVAVGLAAALIAAVGSSTTMQGHAELYVMFPYPFLILGFQILREDFLMASHDRYFYHLRHKALLAASLAPCAAEALGFLPSMKAYKMGGIAWPILSGLRYVPPAFGTVASLWYFLEIGGLSKGYLTKSAALVAVILLLVQGIGIIALRGEHNQNESERKKISKEAEPKVK